MNSKKRKQVGFSLSSLLGIYPFFAGILLAGSLAGCSSEYSVRVLNRSDTAIYQTNVSWDSYEVAPGLIGPGTGKIEAAVPVNYPEEILVQWVSAGELRKMRLKVPPKSSVRGDVMLIITIHEDSVEVRLKKDEWRKLVPP